MGRRFVSIWFRHLTTDWMIRRQPELKDVAFVLAAPERGRVVVKAASVAALQAGIRAGMVVADCRAILPELEVFDDKAGKAAALLEALAAWCQRFTPVAAIDLPDGLILDVSGCAHLWGGERPYLEDITARLRAFGYHVRAAMADTVGAAWAVARYGDVGPVVPAGRLEEALLPLPPAALRLDAEMLERLDKLGMYDISSFFSIPRAALRRRFGHALLRRLDQALGKESEAIVPVHPPQPFQERLSSLEPIRTPNGISIALKRLLDILCKRLAAEGKGLRAAVFKCFRVDGNIQQIDIGTSRASRNTEHLFRLFEIKIVRLEPALGFELFLLEATLIEELSIVQEALWSSSGNHDEKAVAELLDKLAGKVGVQTIHRYLPQSRYWPERSVRAAASLAEKPEASWRVEVPRPVQLLHQPEPISVTVPLPDYPPMQFHYKGKLHQVKKADGPERIEQEWWLQEGMYRDYYCVEDEEGARYWLFRLGHYNDGEPQWFMHGFFA
ncbi:MAG: DNA polymerase Y family protein [Sphingobacteriales bacterium]|nr:MAG: DNA polymerase Y family protein [Sphingobacteriales bacterium]